MYRAPSRNQEIFKSNILAISESGRNPMAHEIGRAIVNELKVNQNYKGAEELFQDLIKRMNIVISDSSGNNTKSIGENCRFIDGDLFRKAIAALVRYAPNPQLALNYTTFYMRDIEEPLRTQTSENFVLVNLIYVYSKSKSSTYLEDALDFVKHGITRGLAIQVPQGASRSYNVCPKVFDTVCQPVLRFHKVQISKDRRCIEPISKLY
ncbi:hypothetical protein J3Q64DRAFT_1763867 [Phycomyces blakesleeanus]|uniref:Uncharacterized protein n=1 Tax=Phycomyces blakesleeanus TaxID=4837 RepID=A0ABR3ASL1_PHYBL